LLDKVVYAYHLNLIEINIAGGVSNSNSAHEFYSLKHAGLKPCNFIARIYYAFFSLSEKNNQANFIRVPIFNPLHFQCRVV
jgi:hypothetical protein